MGLEPSANVIIKLMGGAQTLQRWPDAPDSRIRKLAADKRITINGVLYQVLEIHRFATYLDDYRDTIEFYVTPADEE